MARSWCNLLLIETHPPLAPTEAPKREEANTGRTYKTKEEVEKSKTVTSTVVATLLIIAVVVPMLQYYG